MSIASRITSIEGHIEDDYNALERLGADLTNVDKNIENIASVVDDIYDKLPKVTGTGSNVSLSPTLKGGLNILPLGNCEQVNYNGNNKFDGIYELGTINGNGVPINSSVIIRTKNFTNILPNEQYTITVPNEVIGVECFYYNNNVFIATFQPNLNEDKTATITTLNNANQIKWRFNTGYTTIENKTMFNIGDTAQPYEQYVGRYSKP